MVDIRRFDDFHKKLHRWKTVKQHFLYHSLFYYCFVCVFVLFSLSTKSWKWRSSYRNAPIPTNCFVAVVQRIYVSYITWILLCLTCTWLGNQQNAVWYKEARSHSLLASSRVRSRLTKRSFCPSVLTCSVT